jgi:PAS domain S-box-containing protein
MSDTVKILLRQVPLFDYIPEEILIHFEAAIKEKRLSNGEVLFSEGDPGTAFYIIKSGTIEILKGDPVFGKQIKLAIRGKGDFFGEMSLIEDSPRFATAKSVGESNVLELSRYAFNELVKKNPPVALKVMGVLSSRLRQADLQMISDLEKKNEQLEKANRMLRETTKELEKSNQNLITANKFLGKIISASQFFMIVTDSEGKIFIFNDAAKKVFSCSFQNVAGSGIDSVFNPVGKEDILSDIEKNLTEGKIWSGEVFIEIRNKHKIFIELVGARVFDEKGGILASLYMGRDITEEKNVKHQMILLERMATRGEMAAEIAHELNNYLSIVLGNLELMQMELQAGKTKSTPKKIKSMKEGLDKITRFTERLMMYSRPTFKKELFDLNSLLENELFFIRTQNRFVGVKFICDFDRKLPLITADKSQIQQVLLNLLNNAADATADNAPGQKLITIKMKYLSEQSSIRISIIDNGVGLSDENLGRVFRQHFTNKKGGHGFGLLAVKRVIKNHSGKVWAEHNPTGGAIFNVEIPLKPETTSKSVTSNVG